MAQKHIVFGTGELNNQAWQDQEANNDEIYAAIGSNSLWLGPCSGSKYAALRKAVKKFGITRQFQTMFFYISKFENGTLSGGNYTYTVEVSRASTISGAGTVVVSLTETVGTAKTGVQYFGLKQANSSGYIGDIEVDLDELVLGTTYTGAKWTETGLYAVNTYYEASAGGGGGATALAEYTDNFAPDGSLPIYIYAGPTGKTATVAAIADIVGNILIKNISDDPLSVAATGGLLINGVATVTLQPGGWINIIADNTKFVATGTDYLAPVTITPSVITSITTAATIDGSLPLYVGKHATTPFTIKLDDTATKGDYWIFNAGAASITLTSLTGPGTVEIIGGGSGILYGGTGVHIRLITLDGAAKFVILSGTLYS